MRTLRNLAQATLPRDRGEDHPGRSRARPRRRARGGTLQLVRLKLQVLRALRCSARDEGARRNAKKEDGVC